MALFDTLSENHVQLINQLKSLVAKDISQDDMLSSVFDNLLFHLELEETFLYPFLDSTAETKALAERTLREHVAIRCLIKELFQDNLKSQTLKSKVEVFLDSVQAQEAITELFQGQLESRKVQDKIVILQDAIRRHFDKEEREVFPLAQRLLPLEVQQKIKAEMQQIKRFRKEEEQSIS